MGKILLEAYRGKMTTAIPCWFMRQAGRYLPEYRELRAEKGGFLAMALDPVAAAEITVQPIRRFRMDGAIIFSDILTIPYGLGQSLDFVQGEGPKLTPIRDLAGFEALDERLLSEKLQPVYDALSLTRKQLDEEGFEQTALIGFAGAPWTVMTYMIEGGSSRDFMQTKLLAYTKPELFLQILDLVTNSTIYYLKEQIKAGAEAIKIFDSWASAVDVDHFEAFCIQPIKKIVSALKAEFPDIPVIGFPKGAGLQLDHYIAETKIDALAIDQYTPTAYAAGHLQTKLPIQGNLDPFALLAGGHALDKAVERILTDCGSKPFIFNLGHGINKETPIEHVTRALDIVRAYKR